MKEEPKIAFEMTGVTLKMDDILPVKQITKGVRNSSKYASIMASIKEVGIIEPPVVFPSKNPGSGQASHILLDGHLRVEILKKLGRNEVFCLVSTDDEGFTYGDKVNRLSTIQEHYMILRAIKLGVSEERIAKVLNVDVARIKDKRRLLKGICPEVIDMLKNRQIAAGALAAMRPVKPMRQIEIVRLMVGVNNFTVSYAQALVSATKPEDLVTSTETTQSTNGLKPKDLERMRNEMESLEKDLKDIEFSYENNVLNLTLARGYLNRLLSNGKVVRYLSSEYSEILSEFNKILEASTHGG